MMHPQRSSLQARHLDGETDMVGQPTGQEKAPAEAGASADCARQFAIAFELPGQLSFDLEFLALPLPLTANQLGFHR